MTLAATLPDNGGYVAAAFLVFFGLAVVYFGIMAVKLGRLERELVELNELADRFTAADGPHAAAQVVAEQAPEVDADAPRLEESLLPSKLRSGS